MSGSPAGREGPWAECGRALPTRISTLFRTMWASPVTGWSATAPGRVWAPSPAAWGAALSRTASWPLRAARAIIDRFPPSTFKESDMPSATPLDPELPSLEMLGEDLLMTTRKQRRLALARVFLGVTAYALAAYANIWWITPFLVFLIFVAVVTSTHDVVHGSLGLSRKQTDWALFVLGAALLESGHAYRITHLQHHRIFPGPDDPEGDPARLTFLKAVLSGPLFLPRLWRWAYARSEPRSAQRRWLIAEAGFALAVQ